MKNSIVIKGAQEHNLKNLCVEIPRNQLIVFTGVSGSGKSSLAFDTLYAEGQRRYVESLSAYARQFLGQMEKPKVDYIEGLSPAISIEQKAASKNPRSTVGTVTEIYDYLRVLFARIGEQFCYNCGQKVGLQTVDQMVDHIMSNDEKTKIQILAPIVQNRKGEHKEELTEARREGFVRIMINGIMRDLSEDIVLDKKSKHDIEIVIDRLVLKSSVKSRLADSIEKALKITNGIVKIHYSDENKSEIYSELLACSNCNIGYPSLSPQNFSFNSPLGMCETCNGLGTKMEFDIDLIIPNKKLSLMDGAVLVWGKLADKKDSWILNQLKHVAREFKFNLDTPWIKLPVEIQDLLLKGIKNKRFPMRWENKNGVYNFMAKYEGIIPTLEKRMKETVSEGMKKYYLDFISNKPCTECNGKKLNKKSLSVKIDNKGIDELTDMSIKQAKRFFETLKLDGNRRLIAEELLKEINNRLNFLINVGLHYLSLNRRSPTLSGGESQRIRLASQIGSGLVGVMYILDEPSIGLHQRDNSKLIDMLLKLRELGNTVIVVEHDYDMIKSANHILDFGPRAGVFGGEIIAQGSYDDITRSSSSITGKYLSKKMEIELPAKRRFINGDFLQIIGAKQNNLKNVKVKIPCGVFTCITGVSGSGKSSLINQILYPASSNKVNRSNLIEGNYENILGLEYIDKVIDIDQQPIGRTPRSNPATYIKLFDFIRKLFAQLPASKIRGYKEGRFSFNVKGGRCEACQGAGLKQIEMHFLPDIYVTCEACKGSRFNKETLAVKFNDKNIAEVLEMDVQEAMVHFKNIPNIVKKLNTMAEVGLDYIKLGQASTTLSGGEAQRIKLARELSKTSTGRTLYILDEPTTGLHFDDIKKLLNVLNKLVDMGNTIVVIEHNLDVIKCADYIIDLGPEGGDEGGYVIAEGRPEDIIKKYNTFTSIFLRDYLNA